MSVEMTSPFGVRGYSPCDSKLATRAKLVQGPAPPVPVCRIPALARDPQTAGQISRNAPLDRRMAVFFLLVSLVM